MKNLLNNLKIHPLYFGILFLTLSLSSCSDDDDVVEPVPTGTILAGDQTLSQNTLTIDNVEVGQDSWLVVRNAGDEDGEIVSDPVFLPEGEYEDVEVRLNQDANLTGDVDGDDFIVMLHADNPTQGVQQQFDEGIDQPITDETGTTIQRDINVTAPRIDVDPDQVATEDNEVTINSVTTANDGWVVLYEMDEEGNIDESQPIGRQFVTAGTTTDLRIPFDNPNFDPSGSALTTRLYLDDPADRAFNFEPGGEADLPETYGYSPVTDEDLPVASSGFTVQPGATR